MNAPSSSVTLVMVETEHHALAQRTLEQWTRKINFAQVLTFSDRPLLQGATNVPIKPLEDERAYAELLIHTMWPFVKTDYMLLISWDTLLRQPSNFYPEFYNWDYIGQMWPWQAPVASNMDHCGVSWRSAKMLEAMRYPTVEPVFDDTPDHTSLNLLNVLRTKFDLKLAQLPVYRKLCYEQDYDDDGSSLAIKGIWNIIDSFPRDVYEFYVVNCPQECTDNLRYMYYTIASLINKNQLDLIEYLAPKIKAGPAHADLLNWINEENFDGKDAVLDILE